MDYKENNEGGIYYLHKMKYAIEEIFYSILVWNIKNYLYVCAAVHGLVSVVLSRENEITLLKSLPNPSRGWVFFCTCKRASKSSSGLSPMGKG